jgi:hypothetical protein
MVLCGALLHSYVGGFVVIVEIEGSIIRVFFGITNKDYDSHESDIRIF